MRLDLRKNLDEERAKARKGLEACVSQTLAAIDPRPERIILLELLVAPPDPTVKDRWTEIYDLYAAALDSIEQATKPDAIDAALSAAKSELSAIEAQP
jgi:hypothetical protein